VQQETQQNDDQDQFEVADVFTDFRFKSFRKHKLFKEDYTLLQIADPDEHTEIEVKSIYPENRLIKSAVELVEIDHKEIKKKEAEEKAA
jgi:hypothetical protein